jgi:hypothetical protein
MRRTLLLFLLCFTRAVVAQESDDYFNPNYVRFEDKTYVPYIKTVQLERQGEPMSLPYIALNGNEQLTLQFDLLQEEIRDFSYKFVHCDPNWRPSILSENDYIDGFYTDHLIDYKHSLNTLQEYWHYQLIFPNAQMKPLISGNYLLLVFDTAVPDSIILSKRFYVVEQRIEFKTNIHRSTIIEQRNSHQEADFSLYLKSLKVANPYSDIQIVIQQNADKNFQSTGLKPIFANGEMLDYNYDDINNFEGGSEYRNFDIRTTRFLTQNIEKFYTDSFSQEQKALLKAEPRRNTQRYTSDNDINGKYLIKIYEGRDANLEGDYIDVTFRLKTPADFSENPVYLEGQFSDYSLTNEYRMNYNTNSGCFEKTIRCKQGYYNYRYVTVSPSGICSTLETEGSHYETLNEYYFFAYFKEPGTRYDKLIGIHVANAGGF